jgi:membrane protein DedA with SNARE-associated domain
MHRAVTYPLIAVVALSAEPAGMSALWLGIGLVLTSFIVEDAAIAAGVALATDGMMSWEAALIWVTAGIAIGDMLLYGLGYSARSVPWLRARYIDSRRDDGVRIRLERNLMTAVFLARAVPGLRLVTYTLCGFSGVPVFQFAALVAVACVAWTTGLFWLSSAIGQPLAVALGIPPAYAVAAVVIVIALTIPAARLVRRWMQKGSQP